MTSQEYFAILHFEPHETQAAVLRDPRKHQFLRCGRRWGKSLFGADCRVLSGLCRGRRGWWIAPDMSIAEEGLNYVDAGMSRLSRKGKVTQPKSGRYYKATPHPTFKTRAGGWFSFRSTGVDPRRAKLRGAGLDELIIDEAAQIPYLLEVLDAQLRHTLIDRGGRMTVFSTPAGQFNDFTLLRKRAEAHPESWGVHHYKTTDNPHRDEATVEEIRAQGTPELNAQELDAEEIADFGLFFPPRAQLTLLGQPLWTGWGWDWANGGTAAFVKLIETKTHQLIACDEKAGPIPWEEQKQIAKSLIAAGDTVVMDPHLPDTLEMDLRRARIRVQLGTDDRIGSLGKMVELLNLKLLGITDGDAVPYLESEFQKAKRNPYNPRDLAPRTEDHALDALRYVVEWRWRKTKEYHKKPEETPLQRDFRLMEAGRRR